MIATKSLHGCVINNPDGAAQGFLVVEPDPATAEVDGFSNGMAGGDRTRIADGNAIVFPVTSDRFHTANHVFGRHVRAGRDLARLFLSSRL